MSYLDTCSQHIALLVLKNCLHILYLLSVYVLYVLIGSLAWLVL